jgi:hypothetical protein
MVQYSWESFVKQSTSVAAYCMKRAEKLASIPAEAKTSTLLPLMQ